MTCSHQSPKSGHHLGSHFLAFLPPLHWRYISLLPSCINNEQIAVLKYIETTYWAGWDVGAGVVAAAGGAAFSPGPCIHENREHLIKRVGTECGEHKEMTSISRFRTQKIHRYSVSTKRHAVYIQQMYIPGLDVPLS